MYTIDKDKIRQQRDKKMSMKRKGKAGKDEKWIGKGGNKKEMEEKRFIWKDKTESKNLIKQFCGKEEFSDKWMSFVDNESGKTLERRDLKFIDRRQEENFSFLHFFYRKRCHSEWKFY